MGRKNIFSIPKTNWARTFGLSMPKSRRGGWGRSRRRRSNWMKIAEMK